MCAVVADAEPIAAPGELWFGVPAADLDRLARVEDRNLSEMLEFAGANLPNFDRVAPPAVRPGAEIGSRRDFLAAVGLRPGADLGVGVRGRARRRVRGSGQRAAYAYPELGLAVAVTKTLLGAGDGDPMEDLRVLIRDAVAERCDQ